MLLDCCKSLSGHLEIVKYFAESGTKFKCFLIFARLTVQLFKDIFKRNEKNKV